MKTYQNYFDVVLDVGDQLDRIGSQVHSKTWQGSDLDEEVTEVFGCSFKVVMKNEVVGLQIETDADLPWAEDHFAERVSRQGLNPGDTYKSWPYYKRDEEWRWEGKFSHTYMERMWPNYGPNGQTDQYVSKKGIVAGDLDSIVTKLSVDETTRQAYLPIWFPEDGSYSLAFERVPCTLGYLFNIRNGYLHVTYYIRSCDYIRHFKNDLYLTNRLVMWVIEELYRRTKGKLSLEPGFMFFHCQSMHLFKNDVLAFNRMTKRFVKIASVSRALEFIKT
jgi:thymidylate synthase